MPAPFAGETFTFRNPDGSPVAVRGWGNQYSAVFETLDGYTVTQDPGSGYFVYSRATGAGRLEPTQARVGDTDPATLGVEKHLRASGEGAREVRDAARAAAAPANAAPRRWEVRRAEKKAQARRAGNVEAAPAPDTAVTGNKVGLCVLVRFPDVAPSITRDAVDRFCNQPGYTEFGNNGSVRDYFFEVSDEKLTYTNTVVPYFTAAHNRSYYTDPAVQFGTRARQLMTEALDHLVATGFDFSGLSADSAGYVQGLNLFYAGDRVNNWSEGLWPASTSLDAPYPVGGGHQLFDFQFTNMGSALTIRTFCHENGHMICDYPDLYDYGGESHGAGNYCLMGYGGDDQNPVHIGAYLKRESGWTTRLTTITPGMSGSVQAGQNDFVLHSKNAQEYFIIENRQQSGRDTHLPDNGLLIWHVDEFGSNSNEQMTPASHYEASVEQADGLFDLEHNVGFGDANDLFSAPGSAQFSDSTHPDSHWWDGTPSGLTIQSISVSGPAMTFSTPDRGGWVKVSDNQPAWTDASGWNQKVYYATLRSAVARNDLFLLGRGAAGVDTWRLNTSSGSWAKVADNKPAWTDAAGWTQEHYSSTMRVAVARNDVFLLARGAAGVDTWRLNTSAGSWAKVSDDKPAWTDAAGWNQEHYYATMRLAVARNDLFLLARGAAGVDTWRLNTSAGSWAKVSDDAPAWSDASGWNQERYYATMRVAVARNDVFLLARGAAGVDTYRLNTSAGTWAKVSDNQPAWTDAAGWNQEHYYSTMRLAVARNDLFLLARGAAGVDTYRLNTSAGSWTKVSDDAPAWTDAAGWKAEQYYATMRVAVAQDDLFLLARGAAGVDTWRLSTAAASWTKVADDTPAWTDADGWNQEHYYATSRLETARDDLFLLARGSAGVDTYRFETP